MAWLPSDPNDPRILKLENVLRMGAKKGSSLTRQPAETEGNTAALLSLRKREDASQRRFTSAKYLPFQSYPTRPKKLSSAHSYCPPSKETPSVWLPKLKSFRLLDCISIIVE